MQEETMVRCIAPACGRSLARRVNFCPYCGTPQHAQAEQVPQRQAPAASVAAAEPQAAAAANCGASEAATASDTAPAPAPAPASVAASAPAPAAVRAADAPAAPATAPATAAGRSAASPPPAAAGPTPVPSAVSAARPGTGPTTQPGRPARQPVRLRWWLLALAVLWVVWLFANPAKRRIEAQMDKAISLAAECKAREAQSELIALRKTRATPEQLQRVQKALNEAGAACTRKRQRDKAWREAKVAVEAALATSSVDRARQRLRAFTRRWGEDEATREMKAVLDARQPEHRRADEVE